MVGLAARRGRFGSVFSTAVSALVVALFALASCAPAPTAKPAAAPAPASAAAPRSAGAAAAQPVPDAAAIADFYRGKTIRIIVGTGAGGGYDTYSRTIARHMGKYIPGNPSIVVENMPGAGSMLAANHVYNVAAKDGTVIGNVFGELVLNQLFGAAGVQYDMAKFQYVGVPTAESYVLVLNRKAGVTRFEEVVGPNAKQLVIGGIAGSTVENAALILREVLGANFRVVSGYEGTAKLRLATESGEVDGFFNTWQSLKISSRQEIESGEWLVLAQLAENPIDDLPGNVPAIPAIAPSEEQRRVLLYGTSYPNQFGKVYLVAPEVPPDQVAALEGAFLKTMQDPEFLADAEKSKLEIAPLSGQQARKLVLETLTMPPTIKAILQPLIKLG